MRTPFTALAGALENLIVWERHRIEFAREMALRGHIAPPADSAFAGWQQRLDCLEALLRVMHALAPIEDQVRALHPALDLAADVTPPPTMWTE